ncbi:MAG: hypothetical protein AAGB00_06130 [Planctomycetota bacterium]
MLPTPPGASAPTAVAAGAAARDAQAPPDAVVPPTATREDATRNSPADAGPAYDEACVTSHRPDAAEVRRLRQRLLRLILENQRSR